MASRYLHEESFVDVYLADPTASIKYPYRVQSVKYISPTVSKESEKNIIDSAIGESYSNDDVVANTDHDHVAIVPADIIADNDATIEAIIDLFERTESNVIVPIQQTDGSWYKNAVETKETIIDHGYSERVFSYAVGGVKDLQFDEQKQATVEVRNGIDSADNLHLFGAGCSKRWIRFVRNNRELITSLDVSTPIRAPIGGKYISFSMEQIQTDMPRGTHSSFIKARMAESICTNINYMLSDGPNEDEVASVLAKS